MNISLRRFTNFDYLLFMSVILLSVIGIIFIYSSGVNSNGILVTQEYLKQTIWFIAGSVLLVVTTIFYDYNRFKDRCFLIYVCAIILLICTRFFGVTYRNSRSWIGIENVVGIQPSEFVKVVFILFLAYYLDKSKHEAPVRRFIKALFIMIIPVGLILLQPDLGTASVYIPIFLIMCYIAGVPGRFILFVFFAGFLAVVLTLIPLWETLILKKASIMSKVVNTPSIIFIIFFSLSISMVLAWLGFALFKQRYYYWVAYVLAILMIAFLGAIAGVHKLKEYQMKRLIVFLSPEADPFDAGWNIIQSITAIGAGGATGMGFLNGTQSHYGYLPEKSTDFIFSILSEEWGFFTGGLVVFALYTLLFFRIVSCIRRCEDFFGKLIATGILSMFFFHFIVNIGMVMGIMPITGIPLMFMSYGGSSLWTSMIAVGIILGINLRQIC